MIMPILITLHLLAAVVWVGGMFFAYVCLRPVAASLFEPPQRLPLWREVFNRFFVWVWAAIILLIGTGHSMIAQLGGMANVGLHVHLMLASGYLMIGLSCTSTSSPINASNKPPPHKTGQRPVVTSTRSARSSA